MRSGDRRDRPGRGRRREGAVGAPRARCLPAPFVPSLLPASRSPAGLPPAPSPARSSSRAGWNFFPWTGASCGTGGSQAALGRAAGGAGAGAPWGGGWAAGSRAGSRAAAPGGVGRREEDGGDWEARERPSGGRGGRRMESSRRPWGPGDPSLRRGSRGAVSLQKGRRTGPGPGLRGPRGRRQPGGLDGWVLGRGGGGWESRLLNLWRWGLEARIPGSKGGEGGEHLLDSTGRRDGLG